MLRRRALALGGANLLLAALDGRARLTQTLLDLETLVELPFERGALFRERRLECLHALRQLGPPVGQIALLRLDALERGARRLFRASP